MGLSIFFPYSAGATTASSIWYGLYFALLTAFVVNNLRQQPYTLYTEVFVLLCERNSLISQHKYFTDISRLIIYSQSADLCYWCLLGLLLYVKSWFTYSMFYIWYMLCFSKNKVYLHVILWHYTLILWEFTMFFLLFTFIHKNLLGESVQYVKMMLYLKTTFNYL